MPGHKVNFMNIQGCISYASLQRTAGKHLARMLMKQTLSLSLSISFPLHYYTVYPSFPRSSLSLAPPSPSTLFTLHHHLSYPLSLSSYKLPSHPISLSPVFLCYHSFLPTVFSVLRILTHMACFDDHSHHGQTPSTCVTSLSLNYPVIGTAGGSVYLKPALILTNKSHLTCCLMRA